MPRGGVRAGAGRKPRPREAESSGVVLEMHSQRRDVPTVSQEAPASTDGLTVPPAGLTAGEAEFWSRWAPHAVAELTLVAATVSGFRELAQLWAFKEEIAARIRVLGASSREADPLHKTYIKLSQRVDAGLARFKLTAFGKAMAAKEKPVAANPWARVGARR